MGVIRLKLAISFNSPFKAGSFGSTFRLFELYFLLAVALFLILHNVRWKMGWPNEQMNILNES